MLFFQNVAWLHKRVGNGYFMTKAGFPMNSTLSVLLTPTGSAAVITEKYAHDSRERLTVTLSCHCLSGHVF